MFEVKKVYYEIYRYYTTRSITAIMMYIYNIDLYHKTHQRWFHAVPFRYAMPIPEPGAFGVEALPPPKPNEARNFAADPRAEVVKWMAFKISIYICHTHIYVYRLYMSCIYIYDYIYIWLYDYIWWYIYICVCMFYLETFEDGEVFVVFLFGTCLKWWIGWYSKCMFVWNILNMVMFSIFWKMSCLKIQKLHSNCV